MSKPLLTDVVGSLAVRQLLDSPNSHQSSEMHMSSIAEELTYFENMSRAFATKANGQAWAMHKEFDRSPTNTIWGRIELPTLKLTTNQGGRVDKVRPHFLCWFV